MIEGLALYDLTLNEHVLALWLVSHTFGRNRTWAPIDYERWAAELGGRPDRWEEKLVSLQMLGVVLVNFTAGTLEPNPDFHSWSKARGRKPGSGTTEQNRLDLEAERPLDAALASMGREAARESAGAVKSADGFDWREHKRLLIAEGPEASEAYFTRFHPPDRASSVGDGMSSVGDGTMSAPGGGKQAYSLASSLEKSSAKLSYHRQAAEVFAKLQAVDSANELANPKAESQWMDLCDRDPRFVLSKIGYLSEWSRRTGKTIQKPLSFLSRIARDEGRFR